MPKTLTPQNIAAINNLRFLLFADQVAGIEVTCEVNYGTFGRSEVINLWPKLTSAQKTAVSQLYARIKTLLEAEFID